MVQPITRGQFCCLPNRDEETTRSFFLIPYFKPHYFTGETHIFEIFSISKVEALLVQFTTKTFSFRRFAGRMRSSK